MAEIYNIHEAKTHLSRLIEAVLRGEEVIIAKAGKPVVQLTPIKEKGGLRERGGMKGQIWMSEDFDASMSEEELAEWYDNPIFPDEDQ